MVDDFQMISEAGCNRVADGISCLVMAILDERLRIDVLVISSSGTREQHHEILGVLACLGVQNKVASCYPALLPNHAIVAPHV